MSDPTPTSEDLVIRQQDLVDNPDPRVPVCLLLDGSASMLSLGRTGVSRLDELNAALRQFISEILGDPNARKAAEVCIITFSAEAFVVRDFSPIVEGDTSICISSVGSTTSLGSGLSKALELLDRRKAEYQNAGVDYFQPWLVVITDGKPTDDLHEAIADDIARRIQEKKLSVFPIAVGDEEDLSALGMISPNRPPMRLRGTRFRELFEWLSKSVARVSNSIPGEAVPIDRKDLEAWLVV